jgi:predicted kinase
VEAERILSRSSEGGDPSDATTEVASAFAGTEAPWPGATTVDTSGTAADALAAALDVIAAGGPTAPAQAPR